ncbi:Protein of unknown function [Chitinophaga terrae (ex Kim and Jung 2007)]|jgi:hypothetical protein|uniref:DUF2490 domain-containing protein n=1 Tax=Chitinophaga terrae (ex Kim and Jung 2007) TaxID=408074 RepID=A0A1H4CP47_9BACT|nr:DUF2490 domain-containing protein [Chitinophaga terrae (ex Kim and Jung 2007)]GEP90359.1 hypothetical protein CTE07_20040 [Chitinophaga terrae (ex Kim and Jung 2007)]SEA62134.1 Protein of unknown function [Chitinophaga terrae (ex Kim and Jung 2007)]
MRKVLLALTMLVIVRTSYAQKVAQAYQHWYTYFGTVKMNSKWAIPFDIQGRIRDGISDKGQLLIRGGLQYSLTKQDQVLLGYAFVPTYNNVSGTWLPEHRIFQQYIRKAKTIDMTHRVRLEQRWVSQPSAPGSVHAIGDWKYGNRARYFNRTQLPLNKTPFYVALQDEIFLNLWGNDISNLFFDQNRFLAAFGYQFNSNLKADIGYMNQYLQTGSGAKSMNHILHFSVFQTINL